MTLEDCKNNSYHLHHVRPKSIFKNENEEDILQCWNWSNLRLIPAHEYLLKSSKIIPSLIREQKEKADEFFALMFESSIDK